MDSFDIAIVGAGVVGTATGSGFMQKGHSVVFIDIDPTRLSALSARGFAVRDGREPLALQASFIFVAINTPFADGAIDLRSIESSMVQVGRLIAVQTAPPVVVIRSTVLPGTTEKRLIPLLEQHSGTRHGRGFSLAYNPEFLRAASSEDDFLHPRATVLGVASDDATLTERLHGLFAPFGGQIRFLTYMQAEFVKYLNNVRNSTLISFANEMWLLGTHLGIEVNPCLELLTVISETIWNPAYGSTGGSPYGGTCFPKDTKSLLAFANREQVPMPLLDATIRVNEHLEQLANEGKARPASIRGLNWRAAPGQRERV